MPNTELAAVILEQSLAWGARDFVVCAGARNVPLVLPLLDAPKEIRVWNHFDERAAAFFALGLAKRSGRPVAIVTTSGTAVAELLPATIEAHYSGVPLILITADRPKRFRGTGAPQSILQPGMFGEYVEGSFDCESPEELPRGFPWNRARPIHLNPCFEEPGSETAAIVDWEGALAQPNSGSVNPMQPSSFADPTLLDRFIADFDEGFVLLGEIGAEDRPKVEAFLRKLGAPIWAESTSGLRESEPLSDLIIRGGDAPFRRFTPAKVLRMGGVPSLRFWRNLENCREISVFSVTPTGFSGLARESESLQLNLSDLAEVKTGRQPERPPYKNPPVLEICRATASVAAEKLGSLFSMFPQSEPSLIRGLSEQIPSEGLVFLGNSLPIREWNLAATIEIPHPDTFANRGANGIDGEVSTFLGISEGAEESWGIFGDLTALYDLNAPWIVDQLGPGKRRIVVVNNGGGRIFSRLPSMREIPEAGKAVTENSHDLDFKDWASMWKFDYHRWEEIPDPSVKSDRALIELVPDPAQTKAFWKAYDEL